MRIRGMKKYYQLILCKINGKKLGIIPYKSIKTFKNGIESIGELSFTVQKYYGKEQEENVLYSEIKEERLIEINDDECYVIKKVKEKNDTTKEITAFSREKKLSRNKVDGIEDISITLLHPYEDIPNCYALNDLLYEQTGWRIGYVSDKVLYNLDDNNQTLTSNEKLRYQESITTNWYDYLTNDISEQFECYIIFDSYNKTVNIYSEDEVGEDANLILSYDNYLKNKEKTSDTDNIVTRLTLKGNEELDILDCNPMGLTYIENFSYFIENEEMSHELIVALNKYEEMTNIRSEQWYQLRDDKTNIQNQMKSKQTELLIIYKNIKANELIINTSTDERFIAETQDKLVDLKDSSALLEKNIAELQEQINNLTVSIDNINKLCKKEYATNENGLLIFNQELLDELKEFVYQDTYTNDNITDALTLMRIGTSQLKERCRPTLTWDIDSVNFVNNLIDNEFRQHWNGELGLGDKIILKRSDNVFEEIYLVEYTLNPEANTIELQLSNKKTDKEFSKTIGEKLTKAEESFRKLKSKQYLFGKLEKNRYGLIYDKINNKIL